MYTPSNAQVLTTIINYATASYLQNHQFLVFCIFIPSLYYALL